MTRFISPLLLALLALTLTSCVYYNTFYNAKKRFNEAHQQREAAEEDPENRILQNTYRDYYLSAIEKASVVLDIYADSKWVDDALLLIGKSYYWRGEQRDALTKFDELLGNFPDSELKTEALYWKALALWGNESISQSRELLVRLADSGDPVYTSQARLALAELEQSQENYPEAVRTYLSLVDGLKDREMQTRLWKGLGDTYFAQKDYANAINAFQKVLKTEADTFTRYQARMQIGAAQEKLKDLDGALDTYRQMERNKRFRAYRPNIQLKIANVYRLTGDIDGAQEAYERIIAQNPRTETSAEAYYQIASIEREVRRNNELALELFATARKERTTSDAAARAREMETTLFQLDRFKKRAEKESDQGTEALFSVAEIYLFNLGEMDSALSQYEQVLARKDSVYTPKALYALGMIYADSLNTPEKATPLFSRLVEEYPVTPYAVDARRRIGQGRSDDVLAEARYVEAEALKAEGADPRDVVTILQQVADEYPNSLYAPKALFALGWAYENDLNDLESAADQYERLTETYPLSDLVEISKDKIRAITRELRDQGRERRRAERASATASEPAKASDDEAPDPDPEAEKAEAVAAEERESRGPKPTAAPGDPGADTVPAPPAQAPATVTVPETGPLEAAQVDEQPVVMFTPKPVMMEEISEEGVDPLVTMRVLVSKEGSVTRAVVLEGSDLLHEPAVDLAFQYRFKPGKYKGKRRDVWVEFPINFLGPDGEGEPE